MKELTRVCRICGKEIIGDLRRKYCREHTNTEKNAYMRQWFGRRSQRSREKKNAAHRKYMSKPGVRERWNRLNRERNWRLKVETLKAYGGKCACCGEEELKFLTLHHTKGGGADHRKSLGLPRAGSAGVQFYNYLRKLGFPQDMGLEILCFNCHMAVSKWGVCPHKEKEEVQ